MSSAPESLGRMVLANRPWRLARDLSKLIVGTLATAVIALVNSTVWTMADQLSAARLLLVGVGAVAALAIWLVRAHGLWQRRGGASDRSDVTRANAATVLTLFLGLLCAYLVLFALALIAALLAVPERTLDSNLGHPATFADRLAITWLVCSIATVGGAIGSGLETSEDVRRTIRRYSVADQDVQDSQA